MMDGTNSILLRKSKEKLKVFSKNSSMEGKSLKQSLVSQMMLNSQRSKIGFNQMDQSLNSI